MCWFFLYHSRVWNETWLSGFFYKPCNYELFVKQSLNMEMAIVMARAIIHGLKESGVFSNVVASAKLLSKEKFLSSMEKLQNKSSLVPNSMTVGTQSLRSSNRKIGSHTESQVTGRKVLEIPVIQEKAVLPSSPPRLEDLHREFHEYLAD
ncbi:hypothetical protein BHE74_00014777 [Ensete ventricosum]|nr:hypothetical protein GW17_00011963 [Ensete ventricosum]RWW77089.1 hypothetical protein BHE74_00014777 [Ensete ventricosum]RZR76904.1 hypothetical protein BHM03_00001804 [Ensete ventricosum]